jgi:hypothetical protein
MYILHKSAMDISLIQVINGNAQAIKLFSSVEECYQYIQNMRIFTINDESKTIIGHISSVESADMDGHYLQKSDDINNFKVIKRSTEVVRGYFYNTIKQTCQEIGTIQIVKLPTPNIPTSYDNIQIIDPNRKIMRKSNVIPAFSPEIQQEFFKKLQKRTDNINATKEKLIAT